MKPDTGGVGLVIIGKNLRFNSKYFLREATDILKQNGMIKFVF